MSITSPGLANFIILMKSSTPIPLGCIPRFVGGRHDDDRPDVPGEVKQHESSLGGVVELGTIDRDRYISPGLVGLFELQELVFDLVDDGVNLRRIIWMLGSSCGGASLREVTEGRV
jgi:hypothetical protein